jgi:hypothetical protein
MREILFKAKRVDGKGWVEGNLLMVCNGETLERFPHIVISYNHDTFDWLQVIPETVCQFAGILDKKNTNIFEGDICLDFIGRKLQVIYHNFRMRFEWINRDEFERHNFWASDFIDWMVWDNKTESYTNTCDVTIICNIHD